MSFATRLLEWLAGPIVFLWLITAGLALTLALHTADVPYDDEIADIAHAIAHELRPSGNAAAPFVLAPSAEILLHFDRRDVIRWAARKTTGEFLAGDADVPPVVGAIDNGAFTFQTGIIDDDPVRVVSIVAPDPRDVTHDIVVQVAETMNKRHWFAASLRTQAILPQLFVLLGAVLLVWYGLAVVVRPMARLRDDINARASTELQPLDATVAPMEVQPLVAAINGLMARLSSSFDAQQRFIADAAHQLRSPLAALALQTEQALAETDPARQRQALTNVDAAAHRTARLANRLLALASAGTPHVPSFVAVDLAAIAREVVAEAVPVAARRHVDLGLAPGPASLLVDGDAVLLRELIANLVDNAIAYTPPYGVVTVAVSLPAMLTVTDTGPGIAADERERVFEPFVRGRDATMPGTGLGLAIVRTIAIAHNATVDIDDAPQQPGAIFRVKFPQGTAA
jgi:two-component system sensor histidine kinase TctE